MVPVRLRYALALAALCLGACLIKEKPEKPAAAALVPPWDPAKFSPKSLEGPAVPDSQGAFAIFDSLASMDGAAGDPAAWKPEKDAIDTLRIDDLFDTGFVFPQNPEASRPYAYDDSFRDDTLWRHAYGNGLYTQDHPCALDYVLAGQFLHPAKWLKRGLREQDILASLGTPMFRHPGVLRYLSRHAGPRPEGNPQDTSSTAVDYSAYDVYEGVNLYFAQDSLFAAVLQKSQPCH
jgi:hypothetical protein